MGRGVEELVGDQKQGPRRHRRKCRVPSCAVSFECRRLLPSKRGARLHEVDLGGGQKVGVEARRAQRVRHQGAAPGAELGEAHRPRPAHCAPAVEAPEADQFPEHLADLGRGGEIARRAQGVRARVIAMLGVAEGLGHVAGHSDRPLARDRLAQAIGQRAHIRRRRAHTAKARPPATMGRERSWPMVAPATRKPRWVSGSRKNSTAIRANP